MAQSIYPSLAYEDAARAIVWLRDAFGFEARLVVPGPGAYGERGEGEGGAGATIAHAELRTETGDVLMLLSTQLSTRRNRSPRTLGGTAQSVYVTVPDVDLAHDRAVRAGAEGLHV